MKFESNLLKVRIYFTVSKTSRSYQFLNLRYDRILTMNEL